VTLTLTFIYELDPNSLAIHRICKYELPTSRLSKVIVWQTYIHTDRHDRNYISRRFASGQKLLCHTHTTDTSWTSSDSGYCRLAASHEPTIHFHLARLQAQHHWQTLPWLDISRTSFIVCSDDSLKRHLDY